jgi:NitT/TauT family transport system ATP-binding protein
LLAIIGGMLAPSAGSVLVGGSPVRGPRPKDIAFVFQESTLLPWYTVLENFRLALKFQGIAGPEWRDHAMQALSAVDMTQFANHYPKQLSGGMKQRINLARGLCVGTQVLLLDEPFAALDEQTRMVLGEDLSMLLARTGKTIVFVTHSLAEAVFLADRIVVMTARPGKIKASIDVPQPHPRSPDFMLTDEFGAIRKELYALLRDEIRATVARMREARDAQG